MTKKMTNVEISTVLLVADLISDDVENARVDWQHNLEKSAPRTIAEIVKAIKSLGISILHISSLEALTRRVSQRIPGDVVLSIFGGERSRNRMALVPAICESFGIRFVGPDVYGRVICQDKEISKMLALQCGMITPWHRIVRNEFDLKCLGEVQFPVVVKPNMEGSSIGISERCKAEGNTQMLSVILELLNEFKQPVLVEKFIGGREVSISIIETNDGLEMCFSEIRVTGQPHYFDDHLFGVELKAQPDGREVISTGIDISEQDIAAVKRLLEAVGHVGYCRVDGKLVEGRFNFIELTPDAWLDPEGAFAQSFTQRGWLYSDVLKKVLFSESVSRRHPTSND